MDKRVWFPEGKQREFLDLVVNNLSCGSVRGILQFGLDVNYNALKSYYIERRVMPKDLFDNLCHIAKINASEIDCHILNSNYCFILGGINSKRGKAKNKNKR